MPVGSPPGRAVATGDALTSTVLGLVWRRREVSRAQIARSTGRSRSTISDVVGRLLGTGLVAEVGAGESRGGRRPILVGFQDDAGVILGVDMGATHISALLTDLRGRTLAWRERPHPVRDDPKGAEALVTALGEACLADWSGDRSRLVGIGVAVPSPVDPGSPDRVLERILPAWRGHGVLDRLNAEFGVPVFVDNDANLGAVAERWWGEAVGIDDFVYLKVATGVGAGIMIGGEIYRGASDAAGEVGHMSVHFEGRRCACGSRGCVEAYASGPAIAARAIEGLGGASDSVLSDLVAEDPALVTAEAVCRAAAAGDGHAARILTETARILAVAVANLVHVFNPDAIVIGGGVAAAGDPLFEPLRAEVRRRAFRSAGDACRIIPAALPGTAGIIGAAAVLKHDLHGSL